jgi:hypothetical protein
LYKERIDDLEQQNRVLHNEIIDVKKEAAEISRWKGENMLLTSTMKDKMLNDPRYRRLVENQKKADVKESIVKIKQTTMIND